MKKTFGKITTLVIIVFLLSFSGLSHAFEKGTGFGKNWITSCPVCGNVYKHTGHDISAKEGRPIQFIDHLYFYYKGKDSSNPSWGEYIIAKNAAGSWSYVVHHLTNVPNFKKGEDLFGKKIGNVYNLEKYFGKGQKNHVHVGFRNYPPEVTNEQLRGGLPLCKKGCKNISNLKKKGYPQFPEHFEIPYIRVKVL